MINTLAARNKQHSWHTQSALPFHQDTVIINVILSRWRVHEDKIQTLRLFIHWTRGVDHRQLLYISPLFTATRVTSASMQTFNCATLKSIWEVDITELPPTISTSAPTMAVDEPCSGTCRFIQSAVCRQLDYGTGPLLPHQPPPKQAAIVCCQPTANKRGIGKSDCRLMSDVVPKTDERIRW